MKLIKQLPKKHVSLRNNRNDMDDFKMDRSIQMFHKSMQVDSVDVYLDEPIGDLLYYRGLIQYLHEMDEHDQLRIWLDTPGGDLGSALAIIDAITNSEGNVTTIVTGEAASAGSLIALMSPNLMLGERARFFLHAASYGIGFSKQSDIENYVDNNKTFLREIMQEAYVGFLTEQEMELLFVGKDYYFRGEQLEARIKSRCDHLDKKDELSDGCHDKLCVPFEGAVQGFDESDKPVKPKARRTKSA